MSDARYKVVFAGDVLPGRDMEEVKKNIASVFRLDARRVARLFSGKHVVIRESVDEETAQKYLRAFQKAGAILKVEALHTKEHGPPYREIENEKTVGVSESQKPKLKAPPSSRSSRSLKSSLITSNSQKSLDLPAVIVLITVLVIIIGAGAYVIWPPTRPENSEKWIEDTATRSRPASQKRAPASLSTVRPKRWTISKGDRLQAKRLKQEGLEYVRKGEYSKAEPLYRKSLEILLEKAGKNYPAVPTVMNDLAYVYRKQGRLEEAEKLHLEALEIYEENGKEEELGVAVASEGLAEIYLKKGQLHEIESLYLRAIKIWDKVRGPDNGNTLSIKLRLANLMEKQGKHDEAARLKKHVQEVRKQYRDRQRSANHNRALLSKTSQTKSSSQVKASVSKAPEKAVRIPISISKDFVPVRMTVAAVSNPYSGPLSETPPKVTLKEPAYRGRSQRYGELVLGTREDKSYYYVLDVIDGSHPVLYFDKNQNRDLTDDGPPLKNQGSGLFATSIALPIRQLIKELNTTENFKIWFFTNDAIWRKGYTNHYSKTQMQGHVTINNRRYLAYIAERGVNDADFTNDGIYLDLNGNGKIEYRTEFIGHRQVAAMDGGEYWFDVTW